jgi:hypothetical protein
MARALTVPICDACWLIEETRSGIYVRRMIETPNQNEGN